MTFPVNAKKRLFLIFAAIIITSVAYAAVPVTVLKYKQCSVTIYIKEGKENSSLGSGFIVDKNGVVATNFHVISDYLKSTVNSLLIKTADGVYLTPQKVLAYDEATDIALIQVAEKDLPAVMLSTEGTPKEGDDDVVVIGSPLGLETTVTNGIVSSIRGKDGYVQITAPISPGSSGSPVFNAEGKVIGVATFLLLGGQNVNFAVPAKYIVDLLAGKPAPQKEIPPFRSDQNRDLNSEDYYENARRLSQNKEYKEAVTSITKAIGLNRKNGKYYDLRAYLLFELEKYSEATADIDRAIALDPKNGTYHAHKGYLLTALQKPDEAITSYTKAISIQARPEYFIARGLNYYDKHLYRKSISDFTDAIALAQFQFGPYFYRGMAYQKLNLYKNAINDYNSAIGYATSEDDQKDVRQCILMRGHLYYKLDQPEAALEDLGYLCDAGDKEVCASVQSILLELRRGKNWVYFATGSSSANLFYDKTSIKTSGRFKTVWTRAEKSDGSYALMQYLIHCGTNKIGASNITHYDEGGEIRGSYTFPDIEVAPARPDSVGQELIHIICRKSARR